MKFGEALVRARGQIVFLVGMVLASGIVLWLNRQDCVPVSSIEPVPRLLYTPSDEVQGAWAYVERNRDLRTGLVSAEDGAGWTTIADMGHALRASLAAQRLRLVTGRDAYERTHGILMAVSALPTEHSLVRIDVRTGQALADRAPAVDPLVGALEVTAWTVPPVSAAAAAQWERWRVVPRPLTIVPDGVTALQRHAELLVRAARDQRSEF